MKLSTKGRYAVTALADIALQPPGAPVALADISERRDISLAYLEQIFLKLRKAGLVESFRGPGGGYLLTRPATQINIAEVMTAVEESLRATQCSGALGEGCSMDKSGAKTHCLTHNLWERLSSHVHVFLSQTSLADVVGERVAGCPAMPDFTALLMEEEARA